LNGWTRPEAMCRLPHPFSSAFVPFLPVPSPSIIRNLNSELERPARRKTADENLRKEKQAYCGFNISSDI